MLGRRRFLGTSLGLWAAGAASARGQVTGAPKGRPPSGKAAGRAQAPRAFVGPPAPGTAPADAPAKADERVNRVLAPVRDQHHLPGLVGTLARGDGLTAIGAVGLRKIGDPAPFQVNDRVHLGSCTKAMTATLVGLLVDEGKLSWTSTLAEVFPGHAAAIHPDFRTTTLAHLLTHRAGLPHDGPWWELGRGRSTTEQRRALLSRTLKAPPATRPGTAYAYSNLGYALAGLMAEQVTGRSWEGLMRDRVFGPLGMASAGFGPPAPGRVDEPWGHRDVSGTVRAVREDNAPSMGPAGTVHASVPDWAKFAALHLRGAQGRARLLEPATFRTLQTPPPGEEYAGGWYAGERSWAGGKTLMHSGSNTTWYCTVWLAPAHDLAVLVATNYGGEAIASAACDEAIGALIRLDGFNRIAPAVRRRRNGG